MTEDNIPIGEEVSNILDFAYAKKNSARSEIFNQITNFLERRHRELSPTELSLMSEILGKLITDVEMGVRYKLAERLAGDVNAPVELVILLANDQIDVARPVLCLSDLLSDEALIKIIRHKSVQHQLSIAGRKHLSPRICHELATIGTTKTLIALLENEQANMNRETLSLLVEKSKNSPVIQPPLIERADLPPEMGAQMYQWVSQGLKAVILQNFGLTESQIDQMIDSAVKKLNTEDSRHVTSEKSEVILVNKLYKAGQLTPSFLMKSLQQGQASLFEIAFAQIINVPRKIMRSFLYNRGAEALAVVCCAAAIDRSVFLTIYKLTRLAQNQDPVLSDTEATAAFDCFDQLDKKQAMLTIKKWVAETTQGSI